MGGSADSDRADGAAADVTGLRLLRGGVFPGGAKVRRLPTTATLDAITEDFHEVVAIARGNSTVVDRFTGTAVFRSDQATEIGTLGYVARASGLAIDAWRAYPFAPLYADLAVPVHHTGYTLARFRVRVEEFDASIALLHGLVAVAHPGRHGRAPTARNSAGSGVGVVEGWRGTIVHRVELDDAGLVTRAKIVDPSFLNWPALLVALADTIVPDFPLTNKSFNLSYAGNDPLSDAEPERWPARFERRLTSSAAVRRRSTYPNLS